MRQHRRAQVPTAKVSRATSQTTELASGAITVTDSLTIELVKPSDMPTTVVIRWPAQPSIVASSRFPATANAAMRIMAQAVTRLAALRARGQ